VLRETDFLLLIDRSTPQLWRLLLEQQAYMKFDGVLTEQLEMFQKVFRSLMEI